MSSAPTRPPFSVWAPDRTRVRLTLAAGDGATREVAMRVDPAGWWHPSEPVLDDADGLDYGYLLDDATAPRPDPRSRWQPRGVHEFSRSFNPDDYAWSDAGWTGRPLAGGVVYELHVGTFTAAGTLDAAVERLDHLVALGVDFVELMPVNAFNGPYGWGYDGVAWFAVHAEYGGPAAYQRFVDACHARGLAVLQDVVYNHLGPSGNYLPEFGPYLHPVPANAWGQTPNFDGPGSDEVRRFLVDNVTMWLRDYHVDGLRLDAVHALIDTRATHILEELAAETDALSAHLGRPLSLIAESDLNAPRLITERAAGGYGLTGQWSDDFHHALYVRLTGDTSGYYADFAAPGALAKVLTRGFFHDGTYSSFRGRRHGRPLPPDTPTWRLVVCSDNHDQIGNRADGHRLATRLDVRRLSLAAVLTLLGPGTPMIFMGEEWGAATPWPFFSSHPEPELAAAVARGRLAEFAAMDWDPSLVPNPQDPATFSSAKLDWSEPAEGEHAELLELSRRLLALRRSHADLTDPRSSSVSVRSNDEVGWLVLDRGEVSIVVNLATVPVPVPVDRALEPLLVVGEANLDPGVPGSVALGPSSALVAHSMTVLAP